MLGLVNLKDKGSLEKLKKEQLIDLLISQVKTTDEILEKLLTLEEKELIEYQKELKLFGALAKCCGEGGGLPII